MNAQWQYNPLALPLGISVLLIISLIVLGIRQRHNPVAAPYLFLSVCLLIWISSSLVEILTLNLELSLFAADVSFMGITFFSVAWLGIVLVYLGKGDYYWRMFPLLMVVPVATNVIIWTNPMHQLWRGDSYRDLTTTWFPISVYDYGNWFYYVHMPYGLLVALISIVLLTHSLLRHEKAYRVQILILLAAFCLPLSVELLNWIDIDPIPHYNASTLVFPLSAMMIGWSVLELRLLDLTPIARDLVLENMADLMIVLDDHNRIRDINAPARDQLFDGKQAVVGQHIDEALSFSARQVWIQREDSAHNQITLEKNGENRVYDTTISPIIHPAQGKIGQLLLLHDITPLKRTEAAYYQQVQQVAILEERQRVARELHDSVNQMLFAANTFAQLLPRALERKPEKLRQYAHNIQQLLHGANAEMRLILLELYPDALTETDLGSILRHLCQSTSALHAIEIRCVVIPEVILPAEKQTALYRIAKEALHNIIKHAQATCIDLTLAREAGRIEMRIEDNGTGFDTAQQKSGHFGLQNMVSRATDAGLTLDISSVIHQGTTITVIEGHDE